MIRLRVVLCCLTLALVFGATSAEPKIEKQFLSPPDSARPWVYWFWMDGNVSKEGITRDLEAMREAGIGGLLLMEVDVGIPKGPVKFMSEEWRRLFAHAVSEAERLNLQITLNAGPGWTGSGGPWVKAEDSMQFLVSESIEVNGPTNVDILLPQPKPRPPYFGTGGWPQGLLKTYQDFYEDVAVLAFPTPERKQTIGELNEKALYLREPYTSKPGVRPYLQSEARLSEDSAGCVSPNSVTNISGFLQPDEKLVWKVPSGKWTIVRYGRTISGANTRPAPAPGLGFECDKFDRGALKRHFDEYVGALLEECGGKAGKGKGWTFLHIDSWEMGPQNWNASFSKEFQKRRGYDPERFLPVLAGWVVENPKISERFLWDLRQTAQELIIENHAKYLKELGRAHGFGLSIEPYDMNPTSDLSLGSVADVPMGEFWANCFESWFSVIEAGSIAHTGGKRIVGAESFTSDDKERWNLHPGNMKALGDWAFCAGINRIAFHRYAHQPWLDRAPGMTMGIYGAHWERTQTWWSMAKAYHLYLARCQVLLREGLPVADILYLAPEGAPHVFRPPASALSGNPPDRREFNFDGCAPEVFLKRAGVKKGRITMPDGMSYAVLVLPAFETMSPRLLRKVEALVKDGATVIGAPPLESPSLEGYPECDAEVTKIASRIWGSSNALMDSTRRYGKGRVVWGGEFSAVRGRNKTADPLVGAQWIWVGDGNSAASAPIGSWEFWKEVVIPKEKAISSAVFTLTADNSFRLWINGKEAGSGNNFTRPETLDVTHLLHEGTNVLHITAANSGTSPNPAGLLGALEIGFENGSPLQVYTDGTWYSGAWHEDGALVCTQASSWTRAKVLGPNGMGPWNKIKAGSNYPDIYPEYEPVAQLLGKSGIVPDFRSKVPLRYTHRRTPDRDIYFVANPSASQVTAQVEFRATGASELWLPDCGEIRSIESTRAAEGRSSVELEMDPHGSVFVIFRKTGNGVLRKAEATVLVGKRVELRGPWTVEFQAHGRAPASIVMANLEDWSTNSQPEVKFFSGVATYRNKFNWHTSKPEALPQWLDLGRVEVMAEVTLNGKNLGIAWKSPYRVRLDGALKDGENELCVRVANLWPNRLIGDSGLPESERVAWTTWNPFKPDSPLLPSGLIGPVQIQ